MKRIFKFFMGLILFGLTLTACTGGAQNITESMDGQTVTVKAGESFTIKLSGNPTTGYGWQMADVDTSIVQQDGKTAYKMDLPIAGSGGMYTYHFKTVSAGTTTLNFKYLRSWEKDKAPYKTFTITIEVQ